VEEEFAAEAFDIIVLKLSRMGDRSRTGSRPLKMNFPESRYADLIDFIDSLTLDELIMEVRRHSEGFARGASGYRGHSTFRIKVRGATGGAKELTFVPGALRLASKSRDSL